MNKMVIRNTILILVLLLMAISILPACSASNPKGGGGAQFETIRKAADAYVNRAKPLDISAQELYDKIMKYVNLKDFNVIWYDPNTYSRGPIIVDVRTPSGEMPDPWATGHIPGSIWIPWRELTTWKNLNKLPKDREIVLYSDTGDTGARAAAVLSLLGYDAYYLKWGMSSWTKDTTVAPGRYDKDRDTVWNWGGSYRAVCPISEPTETYSFPTLDDIKAGNDFDIIRAAAEKYLVNWRREAISAQELYHMLYFEEAPTGVRETYFTNPLNPGENPYVVPFLLDVRDEQVYLNGHLCGTQYAFWKDVFKPENLELLPTDRQILVYDTTGHISATVTTMLNMLGYDAINLRWGMTSWSLSLPGKDVAPDRYLESRDCMNYAFVSGFSSFLQCPG